MPVSRAKDHGPLRMAVMALAVALAGCSGTEAASTATSSAPVGSASASASGWHPTGSVQVLGLGDSVMESANCACAGPAAEYASLLAVRSGLTATATNLGEGGLTAADMLTELTTDAGLDAQVTKADIILVTIGANDVASLAAQWDSCPATCWVSPLQTLDANLGKLFARLKALRKDPSVPILVTNYWNVVSDGQVALAAYGNSRVQWSLQLTAATNQVIARQAQENDVTLVDLVAPFRGASGTTDPTGFLLDDGDHPNAAGVTLIARAFLTATPST